MAVNATVWAIISFFSLVIDTRPREVWRKLWIYFLVTFSRNIYTEYEYDMDSMCIYRRKNKKNASMIQICFWFYESLHMQKNVLPRTKTYILVI